jgi:hypothetical protein
MSESKRKRVWGDPGDFVRGWDGGYDLRCPPGLWVLRAAVVQEPTALSCEEEDRCDQNDVLRSKQALLLW